MPVCVRCLAYLVEQLTNFSKVRRAEISGIDADDLSTKVGKFGRIGRRWECKRHSLDGHRIVLSAKLILELDFYRISIP